MQCFRFLCYYYTILIIIRKAEKTWVNFSNIWVKGRTFWISFKNTHSSNWMCIFLKLVLCFGSLFNLFVPVTRMFEICESSLYLYMGTCKKGEFRTCYLIFTAFHYYASGAINMEERKIQRINSPLKFSPVINSSTWSFDARNLSHPDSTANRNF